MLRIEVIQYCRPDGKRITTSIQAPDEYREQYELIHSCGCILTAEMLTTGQISQTISNTDGDFALAISPAKSLDEAFQVMLKMISEFDKTRFEQWNKQFSEENKSPILKMPGLGPTGKFPQGIYGSSDQGELAIGMGIDEERELIIVEFTVPVIWLGLEPEQAIAIADDLINKANKIIHKQGAKDGTERQRKTD